MTSDWVVGLFREIILMKTWTMRMTSQQSSSVLMERQSTLDEHLEAGKCMWTALELSSSYRVLIMVIEVTCHVTGKALHFKASVLWSWSFTAAVICMRFLGLAQFIVSQKSGRPFLQPKLDSSERGEKVKKKSKKKRKVKGPLRKWGGWVEEDVPGLVYMQSFHFN